MSERLELDPGDRHGRDEIEPRRSWIKPLLLIIAVGGLGGGSWWAYRTELPHTAPANVPVIHSDVAPVKTAPADPGGMVVPDQDSILLNRQGRGEARVEQLLPDPEPVLPRPVGPPKPTPPSPVVTAQAPAEPVPPAPVTVPPTVQPAPPQTAAPPKPLAPPAPQTAALPPPALGKGYRLQLGALKTEEAAKQEWLKLQKAQSDVLGKLSLAVSRIELGDKGTYYRIQAGPIADAAQATQACATLKSRNVGCILVKP